MIITLAGHVDHGKTSLVQALTGQNTDRLEEEQRRGLTIDLGFAYLEQDGITLGFVDVPGHHRFIHNMVAGVATMQYALLVIAADDGPMPQSREHLQILELIGLNAGAIALTKSDQVDAERCEAARAEIRALTAGSFLQEAPIFQTSASTGEGIPELLAHLVQVSKTYSIEQSPRQFRLAIDRAFNIKGSGLVVTGTVQAGNLELEQELYVQPGNKRARVRGIHAQNKPASRAGLGDRCAINLAGVSLQEVERGSWLSESSDAGSQRLIASIRILDDFPRPVRHWTPVHVYHATSHTTARLALLQKGSLQPGDQGLVELVLDEPLYARHDDRLVVRDQSLDVTLGGGPVVHNHPLPGRRSQQTRMATIAAWNKATPESALEALLALGPVNVKEFQACWGLLDTDLSRLTTATDVSIHGDFAVHPAQWQRWTSGVLDEITTKHQSDETLQGIRSNELATEVEAAFLDEILAALVSDQRLVNRSGRFAPPRHKVALTPAEAALFASIEKPLSQRQPPSVGDLAKQLKESPANLRKRLQPLAGKGLLVAVSETRFYLPAKLTELLDIVDELAKRAPFSVRDFRDAAEIGRNSAIEVLEYLDARGYTRRGTDTRTVVGDRARALPQMVN